MPFRPGTLPKYILRKVWTIRTWVGCPTGDRSYRLLAPVHPSTPPSPDDGPGATIVPTRLFEFQFLL